MKCTKLFIHKLLSLILTLSFAFIAAVFLTGKSVLFPTAAEDRDVSKTVTGIASGAYDLCGLICGLTAPILIRKYNLNFKFCYWISFLGYSISAALFGFVGFFKTSEVFAFLSVVVLGFLGLFVSFMLLIFFPITVALFPEKRGVVALLFQVFFDVGFILGPFSATLFYDTDGYYLPFLVDGSLGSILAIISAIVMMPHKNTAAIGTEHQFIYMWGLSHYSPLII